MIEPCHPLFPFMIVLAQVILYCLLQCIFGFNSVLTRTENDRKCWNAEAIIELILNIIILGVMGYFSAKCNKGSGKTIWIILLILQVIGIAMIAAALAKCSNAEK